MPITLITGPANAGKAELVFDAVRRHLAHGQEPLLVVPTRADVALYTRELAGEGAASGVRVERFAGLIEEAVRRAGISEPLIGRSAQQRLLAVLAERRGAPASAGFVGVLAELIAELEVRRVSVQRLEQALASWVAADGGGAARRRSGRLYADYRATLARLGRVDVEQRAVRALDALRERPALWGATPLLFYGFDDLTRLQLDAIETLGRIVDAPVTVSLAYEPGRVAFAGRAASYQALAPLAAEHRALSARAEHYAPHARAALGHLERTLFEPDASQVEPMGVVRLLEGGGERAELELVAGEITVLLGRGMAPEEIAVVVRPGGVSPELLAEVFAAAGVPFALQRQVRFSDTPIGRALLGLLRCVPAPKGAPAGGVLGDLLAWLRAPGVLREPALADSFEIAARRAGTVSAAQALALWERRNFRLDALEHLREAESRGPLALLDAAARELTWLFCAPRRAQAAVLDADELPEAGALSVGRRALAELRELARAEPRLAPATAAELAAALQELEVVAGDAPGPGAVAVLDPLALRARRVRALFACGLQENVFPARGRPQPLLTEEERRRLMEVAGLRLADPEDVLASERYLLYATLSRPQELLFLSWHLADDDGQATPRSLFVDDVCDAFAPSLREQTERRALGAVELPPPLPAGRRGTAGLLDERLLEELRERVWSVSSLERWIGCPVAWYVERLLTPNRIDPQEEPLTRGGLAHEVLKDVLEGLRRDGGSARLERANLGRARELLEAALSEHEQLRPLSVSPERRVAVRRRLQADLERYLTYAAEAESPLEPSALELGFGFAPDDERGEGSTLPAVELAPGVPLLGRIDRLDVAADGTAVVYDYKSTRAPKAASWLKDGDLQVALYMRAAEQLLGVPVAGGFYQPLSGRDLRARGVLDADSGLELGCVSSDVLDHEAVRELVDGAVARAVGVAAEAGRGELEARPHTCAFRGGCEFPTICRCER